MEQNPIKSIPPMPIDYPAGFVSNDGAEPYQLEAESTTRFVAWKLAEGEIVVSSATLMEIRPTQFVQFWSCAGFMDTTPAGDILLFDCHGCGITRLEVRALTKLEFLDASFNRLTEVQVRGMPELQGLDVEGNQIETLDLRDLPRLAVFKCASNRLKSLDVSHLHLKVFEHDGNPLVSLKK